MNLYQAFQSSADRFGDKPAIYYGTSIYSYNRLSVQIERLRSELQSRFAIQKGDRVGLWMKNRPEFVSALYGVLKTGGVVAPINNFLKPDEVAYIVKNSGLKVLLSDNDMAPGLELLKSLCPELNILLVESVLSEIEESAVDHGSVEAPAVSIQESDLAVIIYTSGTTGHPKGAMLTHGNLLHNVNSCRQVLEAVDFDRFALLLPMFHSFMLCVCILLPLTVGGSIVLIKSLHPPKNILAEIITHQASILPAIPQLFRTLAGSPPPVPLPLRLCISGAAPLPGEILKEFTEKLKLPLLEGYGLSEASPVVSMNPINGPWKPGSIGIPIPDVEVTIQDEDGNTLPSGSTGEICVRGGNVMQGYWDNPEETEKALKNGWLRTGDIGHQDEDRYLYVTDRKKDMLLVNGINVYPREIEEILYQVQGIKEAAVIGKADPKKGEQPIAFVVMNEGVEFQERVIREYVKSKLATFKIPKRIIALEALPRNATGKVLKTTLREHPLLG